MLGFTRQAGGANLLVALGAVLLLASVHSACAAPPQTILICVSGATFADLQAGGRLPDVRRLAEDGGVALLHNSVWGDFNTNAAFLSVGASERMAAPATGNVSPAFLREYQAKVANRAAKVTAFADALHTVGVSFRGSETAPGSLVLRGTQTGSENVRVVYYRDMGAANEHAVRLLRGKRSKHVAWYFVAPDTPPIPGGAPYRHLGFVVAFGDGVLPGSLLSSPTTRTPGLAANVDIAPTIAARHAATIPGAAGQPLRATAASGVWQTLAALDRQTVAAARANTPVLAGYGVFAGGACLLSLLSLRGRSPRRVAVARAGLLAAASALLALLPVGIIAPQNPLVYGAVLAGFAIVLSLGASVAGKRFAVSPLRLVYAATIAVVLADTFAHGRLTERSLLSATTLSGIRFYGIGNEWFGVLVGSAIACAAPWYVGVAVVCAVGLAWFGADAGGTLAASTAFALLHTARKKTGVNGWQIAAAWGFAAAVTLLFALIDRAQPGAARSHVGAAVAAGESANGVQALADIVSRKIAMNGRLLATPWSLLAISAVVAIGAGVAKYTRANLSARGELRAMVLPAAITGAVIALLFNDGGLAAGLLLLVPVLVRLLDDLLAGAAKPASGVL